MTHINADGEFQSDKYPTTPAGKVPLSTADPHAQDLLATYAMRHRERDPEFAEDLLVALMKKGYGGVGLQSHFDDVGDFHQKFGLTTYGTAPPAPLTKDLLAFRGNFLLEELAEFFEASGAPHVATYLKDFAREEIKNGAFEFFPEQIDLPQAIDALGDLNYVSCGTAHFMGANFNEHWNEIQRANMSKERATGADDARSKRGHACDVVKPIGWVGPRHEPIIEAVGKEFRDR